MNKFAFGEVVHAPSHIHAHAQENSLRQTLYEKNIYCVSDVVAG